MNEVLPSNIKDIFQKVADGDKAAFGWLFDRYYDLFYSTAMSYLKVHELAEDAVQQVYMKLWDKRTGFRAVAAPESYLFIMMRNEILNLVQREARRSHYRQRVMELFSEQTASPEENLIEQQRSDLLQRAIRKLPPQQREAWRLSRDKGMSNEEIARAMQLALPTVKGHISAALRFLRTYLANYRDELFALLVTIALLSR